MLSRRIKFFKLFLCKPGLSDTLASTHGTLSPSCFRYVGVRPDMGQWAGSLPPITCSVIKPAWAAAVAGWGVRRRKEEERESQEVGQRPAGNWKCGGFAEVRMEHRHRLRFPSHLTTLSPANQAWRNGPSGVGAGSCTLSGSAGSS